MATHVSPPAGSTHNWPRRLMQAVWRPVRAGLIVYLIALLVMMFLEESFIFFPAREPLETWQPPHLKVEQAEFAARDGTKLHGWYLPAENARAVVLFSHGNAGNITHREEQLEWMHRLGLSVLMYDYRGYGRSAGSPDESGILADARGARRWLANRAGCAEREIVLIGESLGGGVAIDLASRDGARGLVVLKSFTSLPDVAAPRFRWLPVRLLMRNRLESLAKIPQYTGSTLIVHGDRDSIIPQSHGEALFAAANEPKRWLSLPGHDHNDPLPQAYYQALDEFIAALPQASSAVTPAE